VNVAPMTDEDLPLVRACQRHDPVRRPAPAGDYEYARRSRTVMCRPAEFFAFNAGRRDHCRRATKVGAAKHDEPNFRRCAREPGRFVFRLPDPHRNKFRHS
jgi:hypothetical protein